MEVVMGLLGRFRLWFRLDESKTGSDRGRVRAG